MRRKLLKKPCLLVNGPGALAFPEVLLFDGIAFVRIRAKRRVLEELQRAPGVASGERSNFLEGRCVPYPGQEREFRAASYDLCMESRPLKAS